MARDPHNKLAIGSLDGLDAFGKGLDLDPGVRHFVQILLSQGIETCQSCEGGPGHAYLEPTVDFLGGQAEGPRAVAVALSYGLPVAELRRVWHVTGGEIEGPIWQMTFTRRADHHVKAVASRERDYFRRKRLGRPAARA